MAPARDGVIGDRARREDREPRGLSPTATAAIIATQCGRLSMRFVPRSADPDEASHTLLNELLAGRACGQGRRRGGTRAICTKSKPLAPPALCSQSRTFHRSSAMFGRVTKLTWLGWVRIISGLWRKKLTNPVTQIRCPCSVISRRRRRLPTGSAPPMRSPLLNCTLLAPQDGGYTSMSPRAYDCVEYRDLCAHSPQASN